MDRDHPDVGEIDPIFRDHCGESVFDWGDAGSLYVRLDADRVFTYSRRPEALPS